MAALQGCQLFFCFSKKMYTCHPYISLHPKLQKPPFAITFTALIFCQLQANLRCTVSEAWSLICLCFALLQVNPAGRGAGIITLTGWVALAALVSLVVVVVGAIVFAYRKFTGMDKPYTIVTKQGDV